MLVDTSGLLCLMHRREPQHERAVSFYDAATTRVTHNYVLGEFVSLAQARGVSRQAALDFRLKLNSKPMLLSRLESQLQKLLDGRSDKTVFIRAPRQMSYGDVVKVIDIAKGAGAQPIGLQVDQLE